MKFQQELYIPELNAKLTIVDGNDRPVCHLGDDEPVSAKPDWPNFPQASLKPGKFISPHSMALDSAGNIYVVEWIIGGRITKLVKQ